MLGTMYFSYAPFCLLAVKKNLNDSEQSTVPHEFREYYDPTSGLTFMSTNIQVIDPPICPSLPQFVVMHIFHSRSRLIFLLTSSNSAFAKNVHHIIYERVRFVSLASDIFRSSVY
jgi:hypothetical protein